MLKWNPKPYQFGAMSLMVSQGSLGLLLDPGLGKTSISLATFKVLRDKGLVKRMLVIAPLKPMYASWPGEMKKWKELSDFDYTFLHGKNKEGNLDLPAEIFFINPDGIPWLCDPKAGRFAKENPDILVVDESTKFKNSTTQRFKALKPFIGHAKRRWILTGTFAPNGAMDIFGQIYILDMGRALGRYVTHFRNEFFYQSAWNQYDYYLQPGGFERIMTKIQPLCYQLSAKDYLDMPELSFHDIPVDFPPAARKIYDAIEQEFIAEVGEDKVIADNQAVAGGKCRQICNGALYLEDGSWTEIHDGKIEALKELIEELGGKPVFVLYEFEHDKERLLRDIPEAQAIVGGKDIIKLEQQVARFNEGKIPILLAQSGSVAGLNIQAACHHVIWFGLTWNLEHYDQSIKRVWRQGQKSDHVYVYHIIMKDSADEVVAARLKEKDKFQQTLLTGIAEYRRGKLAPV